MSTKEYKDIDITKWVYKEPKRNANGGFNAYIDASEQNKENPKFQLEECICKFGVSDPLEGSTRRNLELSVASKPLLEFFDRVDRQNVAEAAKRSKTFFKKDLSEEVLGQTLYRYACTPHSEGLYDPLLRCKIATSGKKKTNVLVVSREQNEDGEWEEVMDEGSIDDITPFSKVLPIVELGGMWYVSKGFGCTYVITDLLVWPAEKKRKAEFVGVNIKRRKKNETETSSSAAEDIPAYSTNESNELI
jgi:hypothetical protein